MYLFLWEEGVGAGGVVMKPPPQGTRSAHRAELCRHLQGRDPGLAPGSLFQGRGGSRHGEDKAGKEKQEDPTMISKLGLGHM